MTLAIDDERAMVLLQHLPLNDHCRIRIALRVVRVDLVKSMNRRPIDWRVTEYDSNMRAGCAVDIANRREELIVDWRIPDGPRAGGVFPHVAELRVRDFLSSGKSIHHRLVTGAARLDHDVVDKPGKS